MKLHLLVAVLISSLVVACSPPKTAEEKIKQKTEESVYSLTADDRQRASINARAYFEKEWVIANNQRGMLNECRPSDGNFNGMVTCSGFVPSQKGGFSEQKRFCGYTVKLVGCSDKDDANL